MLHPLNAATLATALGPERLDFAAGVLRVIAHPLKLAILLHLHQAGELSVNALCQQLGQSQPLLSHHLANLKEGGVLRCRREGKQMFYSIALPEVLQVLACMAQCKLPG